MLLSKTPVIGSVVEVSGVTYLVEKQMAKSQSGEGGVYRVYQAEEDTRYVSIPLFTLVLTRNRYAYKIIVGDQDAVELNAILALQGSPYVIKVINSEISEDDGCTHLVYTILYLNLCQQLIIFVDH